MSEPSGMKDDGGRGEVAGESAGVKRGPFAVNWRIVLLLVILTAAISGSVIVTDLLAQRDRNPTGAPLTSAPASAAATMRREGGR